MTQKTREEELLLSTGEQQRRSARLKEQQQQRQQERWRSQLLAAAAADLAEAAAETQAPSSMAKIHQFMNADMQLLCCTKARDTQALKSVCRTGNSIAGLVKANAVYLNKEKEEQQLGLLLTAWKTLSTKEEEGDTRGEESSAGEGEGLNFAVLSKKMPFSFSSSLSFTHPAPLLTTLWNKGDVEFSRQQQQQQQRRGRLAAAAAAAAVQQEGAADPTGSSIQIVTEVPHGENRAAEMVAVKNEILRVLKCIYRRDRDHSQLPPPSSSSVSAAAAASSSSVSAAAAVSARPAAAAAAATSTSGRGHSKRRRREEEEEEEEEEETLHNHMQQEQQQQEQQQQQQEQQREEQQQQEQQQEEEGAAAAAKRWRVCKEEQQWGAVDLWQLVIDPRGVEGYNRSCLHLFALTMLISENKVSLSQQQQQTFSNGQQTALAYVVKAVMDEEEEKKFLRVSSSRRGAAAEASSSQPRYSASFFSPVETDNASSSSSSSTATAATAAATGTEEPSQTAAAAAAAGENRQAILSWCYSLWRNLCSAMGMKENSLPLIDSTQLLMQLRAKNTAS